MDAGQRRRANCADQKALGRSGGHLVDYVYEVIQRQSNALLHPSPIGYGLAMGPGRRQLNRIGPDARWPDALGHGAFGYYLICRVLAEEFGFDKDRAAELFEYTSCLMKTLADDQLAGLPPDEPCPCGSGRKVSDCHGS